VGLGVIIFVLLIIVLRMLEAKFHLKDPN